jgi:hypothetical protein
MKKKKKVKTCQYPLFYIFFDYNYASFFFFFFLAAARWNPCFWKYNEQNVRIPNPRSADLFSQPPYLFSNNDQNW